jgi:hypothetical protein
MRSPAVLHRVRRRNATTLNPYLIRYMSAVWVTKALSQEEQSWSLREGENEKDKRRTRKKRVRRRKKREERKEQRTRKKKKKKEKTEETTEEKEMKSIHVYMCCMYEPRTCLRDGHHFAKGTISLSQLLSGRDSDVKEDQQMLFSSSSSISFDPRNRSLSSVRDCKDEEPV